MIIEYTFLDLNYYINMTNEQTLYLRSVVILLAINVFFSCSYYSKENYMSDYENFILEISHNHNKYNDNDWIKMYAKYERFSGEWYEKFNEEFTSKEKLILTEYKVKYNYYYTLRQTNNVIEGLIKALDTDKIKQQVQYYLDNNLLDDLQILLDKAKRTGKEAEDIISEVYKELGVNNVNKEVLI